MIQREYFLYKQTNVLTSKSTQKPTVTFKKNILYSVPRENCIVLKYEVDLQKKWHRKEDMIVRRTRDMRG